jgi:glutathione synthase/RimK-type ligase-like ATP-grasp enzyme
MIVVISHGNDVHATSVIDLLRRAGDEVLLFDLATLPNRASLTVDYGDCASGYPRLLLRSEEGEERDLSRATGVWWRRPQTADLSDVTNPDIYAFTAGEWHEATSGLWQLMKAPWMNPPARDDVAGRKLLQLQIARELGLSIPRTLVTSDPHKAAAFLDRAPSAHTVFKTFSCTHQVWRETRLVGSAERDALEAVRVAPVIFQEYIPAGVDLRITIVGKRVFSAAIHSASTDYPVDFRMSIGQAHVEPTMLPEPVEGRLIQLMARLEIVYGAFDLRVTPDGEYVFLEVNTAGEFLFVEDRTGLPITAAVAGWLSGRERS